MSHQPATRKVPARLLTTAGWMRATIPLLPSESLTEHLEVGQGGRFLTVIEAELPGTGDRVNYLAVQRDSVLLVVPDMPGDLERTPVGPLEEHPARFLLEHGFLVGSVRMVKGTRLSTFLAHHAGFFPIHDARHHRSLGADPVHLEGALVNACRLVAVVDAAPGGSLG